jgi:hypothetical protein
MCLKLYLYGSRRIIAQACYVCRVFNLMLFCFFFLEELLYTFCVLGLRPSTLFNDMTLFIKKKKKSAPAWNN